jgi:hypothetical protein
MAKSNLRLNLDSLKERKEWKRHPINQGENIYRVLPPFGENSDGYAYRRWVIAWLADPQTGRRRPYASPRSFATDSACPVSEYVSLVEKKREALEASLKNRGASRDDLKEALKPYADVLWTIKPKASYIYNACNKAGEVGLLELKKTAHDAMKKQMMQYVTDYGQDPTSLASEPDDAGIWFKIRRDGEGTNTEYSVAKNQTKKKTSEGIVWVDDRDQLPTNVVDNYDSLGYDLTTLYKPHSYEELKEILMVNLANLYAQYPELEVEGFEIEASKPTKPVKIAKVEHEEVEEYKAPIKKQLNIRFDDEDDEAPAPVAVKKTAAPAKSTKQSSSDDEIFAFAESLLDN